MIGFAACAIATTTTVLKRASSRPHGELNSVISISAFLTIVGNVFYTSVTLSRINGLEMNDFRFGPYSAFFLEQTSWPITLPVCTVVMATVGMLPFVTTSVTVDSYGSIADDAGGIS